MPVRLTVRCPHLLFSVINSFLLTLTSLPSLTYAATGDIGLDLYGLSYHLDQKRAKELGVDNQFNPGLGVHYVMRENQRSLWFIEAGAYRDSGRHIAKLAGPGYQYKLTEQWRLGGGLIYFNSATYNRGRAFIAPVPLLTYQSGHTAFNLTFFPKLSGFNQVATFGAFVTIHLDNINRNQ